jgi:hypothetical protein
MKTFKPKDLASSYTIWSSQVVCEAIHVSDTTGVELATFKEFGRQFSAVTW